MKAETRQLVWIALGAAAVGLAAAFVVNGPGPLWRTELGQRALHAAMQPDAPAGMTIARRDAPLPPVRVLSLADGQAIDLPRPAGRPMLVNIWATWCAPCIKEMPELAAFHQQQGSNGVQVVGIALDEAAAVADWLKRRPSPYPHYRDDAGPRDAGVVLGNPAGVLPYSVLIDAQGIVRKQRIGPFSSEADIADWAGVAAD